MFDDSIEKHYRNHSQLQWKKMAQFILNKNSRQFRNKLRLVNEALKLKFDVRNKTGKKSKVKLDIEFLETKIFNNEEDEEEFKICQKS